MRRFIEVYRGSGRPTGAMCDRDHVYLPPDEYHQFGRWESPDGCVHSELDGYTTRQSLEEIEADFLRGEHDVVGHPKPVDGCPECR